MSVHDRSVGNGPMSQLHWLLSALSPGVGLTRSAIDLLVRFAEFTSVGGGQSLCAADKPTKFVRFSMSGVLKVVGNLESGEHLVVRFVAPRSFFCLPVLAANCGYRVTVIAHEPGLIALIGYRDFRRAIGALGDKAADLISWNFRSTSEQLYRKALLLRLSVLERLVYELPAMARELSTPIQDGIEIATHLTHDDLADLVGATRSRVTHAMGWLSEAGLVRQLSPARIMLSTAFLQANPAALAKRMRDQGGKS